MEDLNIKLLVHGVPQGHKIWGDCPTSDDKTFLTTFYNGTAYDVTETMKVDIYNGFCYYTFIKGMNVNSAENRPGSYFALTLKANNYYADVQNIYYILKKAYEKMCIGLCVKGNGMTTTFIVTDFQSIDPKLKNLQKHVKDFIEQFSVVSDVMPLPATVGTRSDAWPRLNLHECDAQTALNALKGGGGIMVSPYYPAASVEKLLEQERKKMNDNINRVKENCASEVNQAKTEKQASDEEKKNLTKKLEEANTNLNKKSQEFNNLHSKVQNFVREMQPIIHDNGNKAVPHYSKTANNTENTKAKEVEKKGYEKLQRYIPLISLIILIIISVLLFSTGNKINSRLDSVESQMKEVKKEIKKEATKAVAESRKKDAKLSVAKARKSKDKNNTQKKQ